MEQAPCRLLNALCPIGCSCRIMSSNYDGRVTRESCRSCATPHSVCSLAPPAAAPWDERSAARAVTHDENLNISHSLRAATSPAMPAGTPMRTSRARTGRPVDVSRVRQRAPLVRAAGRRGFKARCACEVGCWPHLRDGAASRRTVGVRHRRPVLGDPPSWRCDCVHCTLLAQESCRSCATPPHSVCSSLSFLAAGPWNERSPVSGRALTASKTRRGGSAAIPRVHTRTGCSGGNTRTIPAMVRRVEATGRRAGVRSGRGGAGDGPFSRSGVADATCRNPAQSA
jgi:hypothetical protein